MNYWKKIKYNKKEIEYEQWNTKLFLYKLLNQQNEQLTTAKEQINYSININIATAEMLKGLMDSEEYSTNNSEVKENKNLVFLANHKGEDYMPGITLRKDGRYMIRKMINGKRTTFYTKSYREAQKILNKLKKNDMLIEFKQRNISQKLSEWTTEWEETYKKRFISSKSFNDIHNSLKKVIDELGNIEIKKLTTLTIQKFLNKLKNNRTKERIELYFNALLQKATDIGLLDRNPFKAVQKTKKGKYKNYAFTFEEQEKILSITSGTDIECEILIYLLTGARPSEFPKEENIDLDKMIIHINGTKNEKSKHREVDISDNFGSYLKKHLATRKLHDYNYIQKRFKELCEQTNIKKPILYRLRHTFASNHFVIGTQTKVVSDWMGHTSITITLDTYTDIDKTATKEKILKLYNNYYYIKQ